MTKTKLFAAAAILSTLVASPVLARDMNGRVVTQPGYDYSYDNRADSGFWPADVAAGVVGGAVGTAGAIATAPFRGAYAYDNGYDGDYRGDYARRNGFVCEPGTIFRGEDGRRHLCQ
jgi:hypothetical protein